MGWFNFVGKTFGEERPVKEDGDPPDFQSGLLVDAGMSYIQFFKKLLIPSWARSENVKKGCYKTKPAAPAPSERSTCPTNTCRKAGKSGGPVRHSACRSRPNCPNQRSGSDGSVVERPPQNQCTCRKPKPPQLKLPCPGDLKPAAEPKNMCRGKPTPPSQQRCQPPRQQCQQSQYDNSPQCGDNMESRTSVICENCQKCTRKVECIPIDDGC